MKLKKQVYAIVIVLGITVLLTFISLMDTHNSYDQFMKPIDGLENINKQLSQQKESLLKINGVLESIKEELSQQGVAQHPVAQMPIKHDTRSGKTYTIDELRELMRSNPTFKENVLNQKYYHPKTKDVLKRYFLGEAYSFNIKFDDLGSRSYNIEEDVIVNIHMQKTGGTHLEDRFKKDLHLPFKCQSKGRACKCLNGQGNIWLFTPVFTGYACGLHPDWTQLHRCIEDSFNKQEGKTRSRRFFYITQLRDPLERYLSEYRHQTTSSHWEESIIGCGVRDKPFWNDMRPCFVTKDWRGVSFSDFMACPFNLATNRMTRMLADLVPTQCYSKYLDERHKKIRAEKWVDSAKENIRNMEYFRLMERPEESDFLFAKVFDLHFKNKDRMIASGTTKLRMTENEFMKMIQLAELDFHIYLFAQDIFNHRIGQRIV